MQTFTVSEKVHPVSVKMQSYKTVNVISLLHSLQMLKFELVVKFGTSVVFIKCIVSLQVFQPEVSTHYIENNEEYIFADVFVCCCFYPVV